MKNVLVSMLLGLCATTSQAAVYECAVRVYNGDDSKVVERFTLNSVTDENKFIEFATDMGAGCLVFRSSPELLVCTIGNEVKGLSTAMSEVGSNTLTAHTKVGNYQASISCTKPN